MHLPTLQLRDDVSPPTHPLSPDGLEQQPQISRRSRILKKDAPAAETQSHHCVNNKAC
jgi:hypothetical protein